MKLYLGVGPYPIHPQHVKVMGGVESFKEWTLVDKYVSQPDTVGWDAETLDEVEDGTVEHIYNSHLLEHISHRKVLDVLNVWYRKLKPGGLITINVPDLEWACSEFLKVLKVERSGNNEAVKYRYYNQTCKLGNTEHSFLQIFYGSHANDGEYHKCGFTEDSLGQALTQVGFKHVSIRREVEAHEFGCLIARGEK